MGSTTKENRMNCIVRGILRVGVTLACIIPLGFSDSDLSVRESFPFSSKWQRHLPSVNEGYPMWTSIVEWKVKVPSPTKGVPKIIIIQADHEYKYKFVAWNLSEKEGTGEAFLNILWSTEGSFEGIELPTMYNSVGPFYWVFKPLGVFWGPGRHKLYASYKETIVLSTDNYTLDPSKKKWTMVLKGLDSYDRIVSVPEVFGSVILEKLSGTVTYVY